jgi:hypothetical protein
MFDLLRKPSNFYTFTFNYKYSHFSRVILYELLAD